MADDKELSRSEQLFRAIRTTRDASRCLVAITQDMFAGRITAKRANQMNREIKKMMPKGFR